MTLRVEFELDPEVEDPFDFGVEHVARQPVLGDAEAHHPTGQRSCIVDRDRVAEAREVVRGRQPRGTSADDQHPLA